MSRRPSQRRKPPARKRSRAPQPPPPTAHRWFAALLVVVALVLAREWWNLPNPSILADENPPTTALIETRRAENASLRIRHQPVPLAHISPLLRRAVVLAEDARFWNHEGLDWIEIANATREAVQQRKLGRGASTITQQLARNLYLTHERSLVRKIREAVIAIRLERALEKRRILELYLNHVEWGEGVFGAEAAARAHFGKSAARLDAAEAAILTAMLPAPLLRNPARPTPGLVQRANRIGRLLVGGNAEARRALERRIDELL